MSPASKLLRAAAVQLNSQEDVAENLSQCRVQVRAAAERGAQLIVLPENFAYLGPEAGKRDHAERLGDASAPIQSALWAMAREASAVIVAGGFPETSPDEGRPYNTCAAFAPGGELLGAYRKIHMFDVELPDGTKLSESAATSSGAEPVVLDVLGFKLGLSVCYDLRFPELYRALIDRGAEVLLVPAAFTLQTGKDHWHVLLRARAVEAQSWVIAAAQWGRHPKGRASYGHALIVDPWGTIVAECSDGVGVAIADIDHGYTERVRESLPSLKHRRLKA